MMMTQLNTDNLKLLRAALIDNLFTKCNIGLACGGNQRCVIGVCSELSGHPVPLGLTPTQASAYYEYAREFLGFEKAGDRGLDAFWRRNDRDGSDSWADMISWLDEVIENEGALA